MKKESVYTGLVAVTIFLVASLGVGGPTFGCISLYVYTWINDFGMTPAQTGWISAILSVFYSILCPVHNMVVKALGVSKAQLLAAFLSAAGIISAAFSTEVWQMLLSYSIVLGCGVSMTKLTYYTAIRKYFVERRAQMYSVSYGGFSFGMLIYPVFMEYLIRTLGYRNALLLKASMMTVVLVCAAVVYWLNDRMLLNRENGASQPDLNMEVTGVPAEVEVKSSDILPSPTARITKFKQEITAQLVMLKCPFFLLALTAILFNGVTTSTYYTYIIEHVMHSGYATTSQAAFGQTILGICTMIAAFSLTALMKFNKQPAWLQAVTLLLDGILTIVFTLVNTLAGYYILAGLIGLNESLLFSNLLSVCQIFGREDVDTRLTYVSAFNGVGQVVGPILAGSLTKPIGLIQVFYISGVFSLIGVLLTAPTVIKTMACKGT